MYESRLIHLPLQFFAEGDPAQGDNNSAEGTNTEPAPTFDDMIKSNKEMQAEFDRRMAKAQKTARANARAEWEAQLEEEKNVAKMNADEKAQHEINKLVKENESLKAEHKRRDRVEFVQRTLAEKGLPPELVACVDCSSDEACEAGIEVAAKAFNSAVEKRVNDMLRGTPPKAPKTTSTDPFLEGLGFLKGGN